MSVDVCILDASTFLCSNQYHFRDVTSLQDTPHNSPIAHKSINIYPFL